MEPFSPIWCMLKHKDLPSEWQQDLSDHGLLCFALNEHTLRLVTHLHIDDEQIDQAIQIFTKISTQ